MDEFTTDREQEERLRLFWRENWRWILTGVILGVAALVGWRSWQNLQLRQSEAAAQIYSDVRSALAERDHEQAARLLNDLLKQRGGDAYVGQARMLLAKADVEQGRFDAAAAQLRDVAGQSADPELATIAQLRLARVLLHQGKLDEALAVVKWDEKSRFAPQAKEVRGDIHVARGDLKQARTEYTAALAGDDAAIDRAALELKLQALGDDTPIPTASAPVTAADKASQ